jgi:hypothetical protein
MLRQRRIRRLNLDISWEFTDVVRARGLVLEPVGGTLDPNQIYLAPGCREGSFLVDLIPRHNIMGGRAYVPEAQILHAPEL